MGDVYESMSDDELRTRLQDAGISCGPIVESTRKIYITKLKRVAGDSPNVSSSPAEVDSEEDSPPSTPLAELSRPERPKTARVRTPPSASGDSGEVRQRKPQQRKLDVKVEKEVQESNGGFLVAFTRFLVLLMICAVLYVIYYIYTQQAGRQAIESQHTANPN